jgi:hypothetical protein
VPLAPTFSPPQRASIFFLFRGRVGLGRFCLAVFGRRVYNTGQQNAGSIAQSLNFVALFSTMWVDDVSGNENH